MPLTRCGVKARASTATATAVSGISQNHIFRITGREVRNFSNGIRGIREVDEGKSRRIEDSRIRGLKARDDQDSVVVGTADSKAQPCPANRNREHSTG